MTFHLSPDELRDFPPNLDESLAVTDIVPEAV